MHWLRLSSIGSASPLSQGEPTLAPAVAWIRRRCPFKRLTNDLHVIPSLSSAGPRATAGLPSPMIQSTQMRKCILWGEFALDVLPWDTGKGDATKRPPLTTLSGTPRHRAAELAEHLSFLPRPRRNERVEQVLDGTQPGRPMHGQSNQPLLGRYTLTNTSHGDRGERMAFL